MQDDASTTQYEAVVLRTLNSFAVDIMGIPNPVDLYWYIAQNVVGQLNFVDCVIYEADEGQTELTQVAALGEKNPFGRSIVNPLKIPFGQGVTGKTALTREAIIVDDLLKDQDYIADTQPARSEISVPMVFGDKVVGVIDSEHPDPKAFGKAELEILTTIAAMASAKLELLAEAERSKERYHHLVASHARLTEETNSRKALETRMFEARKLEAIGRLSGGFAHEFNNLLTVISGNLEFLRDMVKVETDDIEECFDDAQNAAAKGADLIRHMLSFSQRSPLEPEDIDLNKLVRRICEWAKQSIGDGIQLQLSLEDPLEQTRIDKGEAENALINLILNAQHAMPNGGTLEIKTENIKLSWSDAEKLAIKLTPGNYVRLSVRDTGTGIEEKLLERIFDPFFTTKEVGGGTGLGLSTIIGFTRQSGGTATVESEINVGSTFFLYFPSIMQQR